MKKVKIILLLVFFVVFGGFGLVVPMFTDPERGAQQMHVLIDYAGRTGAYLALSAVVLGLLAAADWWLSNRKKRPPQ
jgi:hypothetical protein